MQRIFFICAIVVFISCGRSSSVEKEKQFQELLENKEYFKLRAQLEKESDMISDEKKIFYRAHVRNAFNENQKSSEDIDALMTQYSSIIPDSLKAGLLEIQADNYFKTFQYAKSAMADSELVNRYQSKLDSQKVADIKNDLVFRNGLRNIPPQQVHIKNSDTILWKKDKIGVIEIPVKQRDSVYSCIFDTRANISSITKTYATKFHLKLLDATFDVGSGMTGITFKSQLAIADSIYIGNTLVTNAVFQVMPDEVLYIAQIQFSINVIIGYPIIQQLKEVQIYQDGKMIIPEKPTPGNLHNLAMDGLDPIISVRADDDTLGFHFDSGAGSSDFYSTFYNKYKDKVTSRGKLQKVQTGGAGGTITTELYSVDSINLYVGDKKATIKNAGVHTQPVAKHSNEKYYGNLGQDLIIQFKEMILNFEDMYIDFR